MHSKQKFKISALRILAVLLIIAYFREWHWMSISSGDLSIGRAILGLGLAVLCNAGLWISTLQLRKASKILAILLLLPTFLVTPLLAADYHISLAIVAVLIATIAAHNLFQKRLPI